MGWILLLGALAGCGSSLTGGPSLALLTRQDVSAHYEPVAERVERSECFHNVLLLVFFGNSSPNHASVVDNLLREYRADVLLDAEVYSEHWPFLLYNRFCTVASGVPARRVGSEAAGLEPSGGRTLASSAAGVSR